jgi:hypothetical protein
MWIALPKICRNSRCRQPFLPKKPRQTCCSPACGALVRFLGIKRFARRSPKAS